MIKQQLLQMITLAMAAVWSVVRPVVFATCIRLGLAGAIIAGLVFQPLVWG